MTDFTNGKFAGNLVRIEHLIGAARRLHALDSTANAQVEDVLRAAVVFMHGTLEEIIRSLYLERLPSASEGTLNKIPFAAHNPKHRDKCIQLGELKNFSGQYVDNVIRHSINIYVDSMSINNSDQLVASLKLAGIQTAPFNEHMQELNQLMKRRHKVAHQMDRDNEYDPDLAAPNPISFEQVELWNSTLVAFMETLKDRYDADPLP